MRRVMQTGMPMLVGMKVATRSKVQRIPAAAVPVEILAGVVQAVARAAVIARVLIAAAVIVMVILGG